jgi:hypothetical protein
MNNIFEFNLDSDSVVKIRYELDSKMFGRGKFVRQTRCPSDVGIIEIEVSKFIGESDFQLVWSVDEETIPVEFSIGAIEGIKDWSEKCGLIGLKIEIVGGEYHFVDSRNFSYRKAVFIALDNIFGDNKP